MAQVAAPAAGRGGAQTAAAQSSGPPPAYPLRPVADSAMVARGKALYDVNCGLCHGEDARGGDGGTNLIRGTVLLNDQNGELLGPVLDNGRLAEGMPKFNFTNAQILDIAAFLHSFRVGGYDVSRNRPATIVVGNAKAGEAYFKSKCANCHSATGDLSGFASRFSDERALQQRWLMPAAGGRGGPPAPVVTVTVALPSGEKFEGRLGRIDDFVVTLTEPDGTPRSFRREGNAPKVDIHDPLKPHKDLLSVYTDKDIHDITAYLVTLK
ncbi:MAG: c-type cytochrome [Bryobacterales bacterium]|nr:c-type cytochrome [Bryobacterales bacterium]MBV9397500.1 c-type cytochrome [Bryobacterales bacterium]